MNRGAGWWRETPTALAGIGARVSAGQTQRARHLDLDLLLPPSAALRQRKYQEVTSRDYDTRPLHLNLQPALYMWNCFASRPYNKIMPPPPREAINKVAFSKPEKVDLS